MHVIHLEIALKYTLMDLMISHSPPTVRLDDNILPMWHEGLSVEKNKGKANNYNLCISIRPFMFMKLMTSEV